MFKFKNLLLSNKNIVGLGLSSIVIILGFIGILKSLILPLAILFYIFGYLITPKEVNLESTVELDNKNYLDILSNLNITLNNSKKLPNEAREIIERIYSQTSELIEYQKKKQLLFNTNEDGFVLESILDSYIPKIINQYNLIPASYANNEKASNGKTAKEMIIEQLLILEEKIKEISNNIYANDISAIKINGNFLKKKFTNTQLFEFEKE